MTQHSRVLILTRDSSEAPTPLESALRARGTAFGVMDVGAIMAGKSKISCLQSGKNHEVRFTDARSGQLMTDESVSGVWLENLSFVQTPIDKDIDAQSGPEYIEHIGTCEAWLTAIASVGATSHNRVCLPNPENAHLDVPMRHLQLARTLGLPTLAMCGTSAIDRVYDFIDRTPGQLRRVPFRRFAFTHRKQRYFSTECIIEPDRMFSLAWIRGAEMFTEWPKTWCWYQIARLGTKTTAIRLQLKEGASSPQITDISFHAAHKNLDIEAVELPQDMKDAVFRLFDTSRLDYAVIDIVEDLDAPQNWYFTHLSTKVNMALFDEAGLGLTDDIATWLETGSCPT